MYADMAAQLASVVVEYAARVEQGEFVAIITEEVGRPLAEELYEACLRQGAHPKVIMEDRRLQELLVTVGSAAQIGKPDPINGFVIREADVLIRVSATSNTRSFAQVPAEHMALYNQAYGQDLSKLIERIGDESMKYCLVAWPSQAGAQEANMGFFAYQELLFKAGALDKDDPVAYWQGVANRQQELVDWLNGKERVVVEGPGIDLRFSLAGRRWQSAHGTLNFPDGEIYTGPVEDSVEGSVKFNLPSLAYGQELRGAQLRFKGGKVVEASAELGGAFLASQLELDEGASRLGEFAIGTNWGIDRVTGSTLLDEKIGGTIHMALGKSIASTGGQNESKLHWDLVHDMKDGGRILIDDQLVYDSGEFKLKPGP